MLNLYLLPPVDPKNRPRPLYLESYDFMVFADLQERGYAPVVLATLPRTSEAQERTYLLAKAQAIEEGTVESTDEQLKALTLEMKAAKLLDSKSSTTTVVHLDGATARDLLAWGQRPMLTLQAAKQETALAGHLVTMPALAGQADTQPAPLSPPTAVLPSTRQTASKTVRDSPVLNDAAKRAKTKKVGSGSL